MCHNAQRLLTLWIFADLCTAGFNRTGFVVCSYLIEHCGLTVEQALDSFSKSRPPGVKHEKFRQELHRRYTTRNATVPLACPGCACTCAPQMNGNKSQHISSGLVPAGHTSFASYHQYGNDGCSGSPRSLDENSSIGCSPDLTELERLSSFMRGYGDTPSSSKPSSRVATPEGTWCSSDSTQRGLGSSGSDAASVNNRRKQYDSTLTNGWVPSRLSSSATPPYVSERQVLDNESFGNVTNEELLQSLR